MDPRKKIPINNAGNSEQGLMDEAVCKKRIIIIIAAKPVYQVSYTI